MTAMHIMYAGKTGLQSSGCIVVAARPGSLILMQMGFHLTDGMLLLPPGLALAPAASL